MGICLSLPFVMDSINSFVTTHVYDATENMALPWYIGTMLAFISLLLAVCVDRMYMEQIQKDLE